MYDRIFKKIADQMVVHASDLRVNQVDKLDSETIIGARCHPEDYAHLIGREARNIKALKHIFSRIGFENRSIVTISVDHPSERFQGDRTKLPFTNGTHDGSIAALLGEYLGHCGYPATVEPEAAGNRTILKVFASRPVPVELSDAFSVVFACIGKMKGRGIQIDV